MRTPTRALAAVVAGATVLLGAQLGLATSAHAASTASISLSVPNPGVLTIGKPATITTHMTGNGSPHNGTLTFVIDGLSVLKAADFTLKTSTGVNIPLANAISGDNVDVVGSITEGGGYLPASGVKSTSFTLEAKADAAAPVRGELFLYVDFESTDDSVQVENQGAPLQVPKPTPYKVAQNVAVVRKDESGLPDIYYAASNTNYPGSTEVVPSAASPDGTSPSLATELGSTATVVGGDIFGSGDDYPIYYVPGVAGQASKCSSQLGESCFYVVDGFDTDPSNNSTIVDALDYQAIPFGVGGDVPLTGAFPIPSDSSAYPYGSFDDIAVWRPGNQHFYVLGGASAGLRFGVAGDIPVVGNWTGTRDADGDQGGDGIGVFRPGNATWYLLNQSGNTQTVKFGVSTDTPVVGDWSGNGVSTIGVRRGTTYYLAKTNTSPAYSPTFNFGVTGDGTFAAYTYTPGDAVAVADAYAGQSDGDAHAARVAASRLAIHATRVRTAGPRTLG